MGGAPSGYTLRPGGGRPAFAGDLVFHTPEALFTEERPPDWTTRVWPEFAVVVNGLEFGRDTRSLRTRIWRVPTSLLGGASADGEDRLGR